MSSPGFEPRANGTAVNIADHYTGWTTRGVFSVWHYVSNLRLNRADFGFTTLTTQLSQPGGAAVAQWSRYRIMADMS
ncbi:hypothetical protein TNCV_4978071 [Trichonephila clavipes]|nr:hypothetical protein TNCV_4978071 [Trichonephila clavipes]